MDLKLYSGKDDSATSGPVLTSFKRYLRCPLGNAKCCCHQELEVFAHGTQPMGKAKESFWCCVPSIDILKPDGTKEYMLSPPTCCGGMMVDCCAEGCCNCRIPIYIYVPGGSGATGTQIGKLVKVWAGLANELFTEAHTVEVEFPVDSSPDAKERILGGALLMNQVFFGKDGGGGG